MKKGFWLVLLAILFGGVIVYALWYINKRGELQNNSKDSFIPCNSALVININPGVSLSSKIKTAFASDLQELEKLLLYKAAYALSNSDLISPTSKVMAVRTEGKDKWVSLFVMDNKNVLSGSDIVDFLQKNFGKSAGTFRKYDRYKIQALHAEKEEIFYAVEEGMVLLSDSELYIEDALKQFEQNSEGIEQQAQYQQINKYFSASAGLNVFLNASYFADLLPMFIQTKKLFPRLDIASCFKWGALDGELQEEGIGLNGFMDYAGLEASFMKTLEGQKPGEAGIDAIIPADVASFFVLNLSDFKTYLTALDNYRYNAGLIEQIRKRKQEYTKLLGKDYETELKELLQGEFVLANMAFNERESRNEGVVIAELKSGGLCKTWIEKIIGNHARLTNVHPDHYIHKYAVDREQSFTYYTCPEEDMPAVFWGYLFEGIPAKYVLIQDNYLIFGSSEKVIGDFIRSYVHRNFIRDTDWFNKIKIKLSAKYNLAYFANAEMMMPYYKAVVKKDWKQYMQSREEALSVFTALAMQWSNEGGILYNTSFLSTEKSKDRKQPHLLWQTKLGARISMKPVPVTNHVTGEREIFVQDENNDVYLLNDAGRILWRLALGEPINSDVIQVDAFRNGKLQYLFSTPSRLHLVDRNGEYVDNFPVTLKADTKIGMALYDYDKNRNYRIFVPCADRRVYLYDIRGQLIKDWKSGKTDKDIVTRVNHYRIGDKDYIVYADQYRLYIQDRKGKERIKISNVFDLWENTELYLTRRNGKMVLAFAGKDGAVNIVDFQGKVEKVNCIGSTPGFYFNVADINADSDVFIFTSGNRLSVYDLNGKCLYEKELDAAGLDFPYVYRFSGADVRIGLLDKVKSQMMLLNLKSGMSEGFPINGDSPFSIIFADNGNFYLFAGVDNGSLIKYKVQR